jgi:hypothetical protein
MDLSAFISDLDPWTGGRQMLARKSPMALVVDDSVHSGAEMRRVKELVRQHRGLENVMFGAAYVTRQSLSLVDTFSEIIEHPRAFEWNILNHPGLLATSCLDIDGVLCQDPTVAENDDGPRYLEFLRDAKALHIPQYFIGQLVTSRLELYRPETVSWLERNGVKYGSLTMLDLPTAEIRRRRRASVFHKAIAYMESGFGLFIESCKHEAGLIHDLTGLPVFSVEGGVFYSAG